MNIKDVSFIIPFRNSTDERLMNCIAVLKWLGLHYPDTQVIVAENGTKTELSRYNRNINHIHIQCIDKFFNKSKTINVGVFQAYHELLIILDSDMIMNPKDLNKCIQGLRDKYEAVNPFECLIDLSQEKTNEILTAESPPIVYPLADKETSLYRKELNFSAAIVMIRRDCFFRIGGWPDEFEGWGGEDDISAYKIERFLKCKTYPNNAYHLYHKRCPQQSKEEIPGNREYIANCDAMDRIIRMSDEEFIEYCQKSRECLLASHYSHLTRALTEKFRKEELVIRNPRIDLTDFINEKGKVGYYPINY